MSSFLSIYYKKLATGNRQECHCGNLILATNGEPVTVIMYHCEHCQRCTGTSHHFAAWSPVQDVTINGEVKRYSRTGERGEDVEFGFCQLAAATYS